MAEKLRYGKGKGSIELSGELHELVFRAITHSHGKIMEAMREEVMEVEMSAKKDWPVRQKKYGKSQSSRTKFERGFRVVPDGLEAYLANRAKYAWAIKSGIGSSTSVETGERVSEELLWNPIRQKAEVLAHKIANIMMRQMR